MAKDVRDVMTSGEVLAGIFFKGGAATKEVAHQHRDVTQKLDYLTRFLAMSFRKMSRRFRQLDGRKGYCFDGNYIAS